MSTLNLTSLLEIQNKNTDLSIKSHWLTVKNSNYNLGLVNEFVDICQQYDQDERWILMIDPQEKDIALLNQSRQVNRSKILRINSKKVKLNSTNIKTTLAKGNCSAIILCNTQFAQQQLSSFNQYAKQGNTQCIVLNSSQKLH